VFIDKYTQVPRILAPIVQVLLTDNIFQQSHHIVNNPHPISAPQCIEQLPSLVDDPAFHRYVSTEWGSIDGLRLQVLSDFFKHGFDGSGEQCCVGGVIGCDWNVIVRCFFWK
jgi:hypothetical protein